jgi:hypothetical protein
MNQLITTKQMLQDAQRQAFITGKAGAELRQRKKSDKEKEAVAAKGVDETIQDSVLPNLRRAAEAGYSYWRREEHSVGPVHEASVRLQAERLQAMGLRATYFMEPVFPGLKSLILTVNW